ncbi:hypothetical protein AMATHDRAFT_63441 [Amanita thiersii Skay4041]|uniref:Uncharacterized protein n=1 Tax=Amanita thiersii Skay4041 TaxID=703135 RepID=A0A2A9NFB3_9AGAR|nr:hypothetical protein AMATHDRAFT_63441 [Amanita thiersii Skay4041]
MRSLFWEEARLKVRTVYKRITLNWITIFFFVLSVLYCFGQGIVESFSYTLDTEYHGILSGITKTAGIPFTNITYLTGFKGTLGHLDLRMCSDIPYGKSPQPCVNIFNSSDYNEVSTSLPQSRVIANLNGGVSVEVHRDEVSSQIDGVTLILRNGTNVFINDHCAQILVQPRENIRTSRSEDITIIALQFWLLIISVIAIVFSSVPHLIAVLFTRFMISGGMFYRIWRTEYRQNVFDELVAKAGTPCSLDILSSYSRTRMMYEIINVSLGGSGFLILALVSIQLIKVYNTQSVRRIGAPKRILRMHKFFLAILACMQMELITLIVSLGLWIDIVMNTAIGGLILNRVLYQLGYISTAILLVPWIILGWKSIRGEKRKMMNLFIAVDFVLIAIWSITFYSQSYRWTFVQWPFMGAFSVASFVLLTISIILGVTCRLNFGKGLAEYLNAEDALARVRFAPEVFTHDSEADEKASPQGIIAITKPKAQYDQTRRTSSTSEFFPALRFSSRPQSWNPTVMGHL